MSATVNIANDPKVEFQSFRPKRKVQTGHGQECGRCDGGACRRVAVLAATIPGENLPKGFKPIRITCCDRQECKEIARGLALAQYASRAIYRR